MVNIAELGCDQPVLLVLPNHAERRIIHNEPDDGKFVLNGRRDGVDGDHEAAIAGNAEHGVVGLRDLEPERGRKGPAHAGKTAGTEKCLGLLRLIETAHPNAIVASIKCDEGRGINGFLDETDDARRQRGSSVAVEGLVLVVGASSLDRGELLGPGLGVEGVFTQGCLAGRNELCEDGLRVANEGTLDGKSPSGVVGIDVDLKDLLTGGGKNGGPLAHGVLRGELGADDEDDVSIADHRVRSLLAEHADHTDGEGMGLGDRAFAFIGRRDGGTEEFGEATEILVSVREVDAVAGDDDRIRCVDQEFGGMDDIVLDGDGRRTGEVAGGRVDVGSVLLVNVVEDGLAAEDDGGRTAAAAGGVLDGELCTDDRFLRRSGEGGVLGHGAEDGDDVRTTVVAGDGLVGGMLGHEAVRSIGDDHHRAAADEGLHDAESGVRTHKSALTHDEGGAAGSASVGIRHDGGTVLVADEDGGNAVALVVEAVEDLEGTAARETEDVLNARLGENACDQLFRLRHVSLPAAQAHDYKVRGHGV